MKNFLIFILGVIVGGLLTLGGLYELSDTQAQPEEESNSGITLAEQQTEFELADRFEVVQVIDGGALANSEKKEYGISYFSGPLVYILADGQNLFYDDQVVEVPAGKKAMQIGVYRYMSNLGEKVVPVLEFQ